MPSQLPREQEYDSDFEEPVANNDFPNHEEIQSDLETYLILNEHI